MTDAREDLAALTTGAAGSSRPVTARDLPPPGAPGPVRDAAVLVLFGVLDEARRRATDTGPPRPEDLDLLLLARAATLRAHAGQVAFPGGRVEEGDTDPCDTALREAVEETGLDRGGVDVLGALTPRPLPVSNHRVTPVLAWWSSPSPVRVVDEAESARVFRAPVAELLDPDQRRTAVVQDAGRRFRSPAFLLPDHPDLLVWGFTGFVLASLFDDAGWSRDWDEERTITPARGRGARRAP